MPIPVKLSEVADEMSIYLTRPLVKHLRIAES